MSIGEISIRLTRRGSISDFKMVLTVSTVSFSWLGLYRSKITEILWSLARLRSWHKEGIVSFLAVSFSSFERLDTERKGFVWKSKTFGCDYILDAILTAMEKTWCEWNNASCNCRKLHDKTRGFMSTCGNIWSVHSPAGTIHLHSDPVVPPRWGCRWRWSHCQETSPARWSFSSGTPDRGRASRREFCPYWITKT